MLRRIACCSALLLLLTACTGGRAPVRKAQPETPSVVTIKAAVCQSPSEQQTLDALIAAYQEQQPGTRVEAVGVPCHDIESIRRLPDSLEFDLVPVQSWGPGDRRYVDLGPYMGIAGMSEQPFGRLLDEGRVNGRLIALPIRVTPHLIWANKSFFDKAGIPLPTGGWTWEEFRSVAARLGAQRTDGSREALAYELPEWLLRDWVEGRTGRPVFEADEETLRAALVFFQTLVLTDRTLAMPPARDWSSLRSGEMPGFWEGRVPLAFGSVPPIPELIAQLTESSMQLLPMPTHPSTRPVTEGQKSWYGILAKSAQPDAAFAFLAFAAGPAGAAVIARAGYFPAVPNDAVGQIWADWSPPLPPIFQSLVDTRLAPDYQEREFGLELVISRAANRVMRGELAVDDALAEIASGLNKIKRRL